tara:strand:+ start:1983 stop:2225 length:243 start_codon:yes stop_codon:yes gene_type:complete
MSDIYTERDDVIVKGNKLPRHGSPQDRGSADAYYGRPYDPHYYLGASITSDKVYMHEMTEEEIEAYKYGYENEDDRKDWG